MSQVSLNAEGFCTLGGSVCECICVCGCVGEAPWGDICISVAEDTTTLQKPVALSLLQPNHSLAMG